MSDILMGLGGAQKVSMAGWLKPTTCDLFGISLEDLERSKNEQTALPEISVTKVQDLLKSDSRFALFESQLLGSSGMDGRSFLQMLGTEICRSVDPDFHCQKAFDSIQKIIKAGGISVSDDIRFKNELSLRDMGGNCFFVIAPWNWEVSNHSSETSLTWSDFPSTHIIVNDLDLESTIKKWTHFFDRFSRFGSPWENKNVKEISDLLDQGLSSAQIAEKMGYSRDKVVWWCERANLRLRRTEYPSDNRAFLDPTPEAAYWAGLITADGCIKKSGPSETRYLMEFCSTDKELIDGYSRFIKSSRPPWVKTAREGVICGKPCHCKEAYYLCTENPFILENLKLWNLKPRKSTLEEVPWMVEKHPELFYHWLRGFIDGDGCVYTTVQSGRSYEHISILASNDLTKWITETVQLPHAIEFNHRNVQGLNCITYAAKSSIELKKRLQGLPRLERKWNK